jgi:3-(3-hydroxy-phenyl)propionate hydroxylase
MRQADCDILVCGLGPVGQVLANLLGVHGVSTIAVDAAAEPYDLPRGAVIDDEVLRILQAAGLETPVLADAQPQPRISFVTADGERLDVLTTETSALGHPPLVSIHQPTMERTLLAALAGRPSVVVRRGERLEAIARRADHVTAWVRPDGGGRRAPITARWLIGCDGARSTVRSHIGIPFGGSTFAQAWLVADALCDRAVAKVPHPHFVGDPARPAVSLPMSPGRHRWEWLLHPGEHHAAFTDRARVGELIQPWLSGEEVRIERAVVYTFHARRAARWRAGRVLLAGDAAHVMPPFAGQGLSSGARDAANLAWKLAAVVDGAPPRLLDSYELERRAHVASMARLAVRWGGVVQTTDPRTARWRDRVLRATTRAPRLSELVKPLPTYSRGAFARQPARSPWRRGVGSLFPQPLVHTAGGAARLDDVLGPGWTAIARRRDAARALRRTCARTFELGRDLEDSEDGVARWLDRHRGDWVLLRPDRFVFACGRAPDLADATVRLRTLLGSRRAALAEARS